MSLRAKLLWLEGGNNLLDNGNMHYKGVSKLHDTHEKAVTQNVSHLLESVSCNFS